MIVDSIMTRAVVALSHDSSVRAAARLMKEKHIGCVVVTRAGLPCGIVTERDLTHRVLATGRDPDLTAVVDVMSTPLAFIEPACQIEEAAEKMRTLRVRRLVVMLGRELRGIVTVTDVAYASHDRAKRFVDGWVKHRWID